MSADRQETQRSSSQTPEEPEHRLASLEALVHAVQQTARAVERIARVLEMKRL